MEKLILNSDNNSLLLPSLPKEFNINFQLPIITFDEEGFDKNLDEFLAPILALGDNLDKNTLSTTLASLRKYQKSINDNRIIFVKEVKKPITHFENKVKIRDAKLEEFITKFSAQLSEITNKEKQEKKILIDEFINIQLATTLKDCDQSTKNNLTILDEYYLIKWSLPKIEADLAIRAADLFKQFDYQRINEELKNTQIESRQRLIQQLNEQYGFSATYANMPIEKFNDDQVHSFYISKAKLREEESKNAEIQKELRQEATEVPVKLAPVEDKKEAEINAVSNLIFRSVRLGAESQLKIMHAIAKLKEDGISVEFI